VAVITVAQWRTWAKQEALPAAQDTVIQGLIDDAQAQIELYCRLAFTQTAVTDVLDGTGTAIIELSRVPVASIAEIRVGNAAPYDVVAASDYVLYPETGIVQLVSSPLPNVRARRRGRLWPEGERNIAVDYTGGVPAASVPKPVLLACKMQTSTLFWSLGADPRVVEHSAGRHTRTKAALGPYGLAWDVIAVLEGQRRLLHGRIQGRDRVA
jgi:hypothetical protein